MTYVDTGLNITDGTYTVYIHSANVEYDIQKTNPVEIPIPDRVEISPTGAKFITEKNLVIDMGMRERAITITGTIDSDSETNSSTALAAAGALERVLMINDTCTLNWHATSTTATNAEVIGTHVTVEVASTTGFANGDWIHYGMGTGNLELTQVETVISGAFTLAYLGTNHDASELLSKGVYSVALSKLKLTEIADDTATTTTPPTSYDIKLVLSSHRLPA